ncbi:MAG: hypothetical protein ACFFFT_02955 [Candidatus Thorarchaeota archaeon]
MEKANKYFDTLYDNVPGYIFGLLTFAVGFSSFIIALILSPDYVMWEKSISVLGHKKGGIFSRMGLIISNTLAIPFIIYLARTLKDENVSEKVRKVAIGAGIFISVNAVLTGAVSGGTLSSWHGLFALLSWMGGNVVCSIFGYLMLKNPKFSKSASYFSIGVAVIFGSYLIPFFITNFCSAFPEICKTFGDKVYTIMPIYEWVVMFSILFWYLFYSIYILYKKI